MGIIVPGFGGHLKEDVPWCKDIVPIETDMSPSSLIWDWSSMWGMILLLAREALWPYGKLQVVLYMIV